MKALLALLIQKIVGFADWIGQLFKGVFVSIWDLFKDGFCWALETLLKLAVSGMNSFDTSGITANLGAFSSVPAEALNVLSLLGGGEASAIIAAAIAIRFGLQLIPFVRLGS